MLQSLLHPLRASLPFRKARILWLYRRHLAPGRLPGALRYLLTDREVTNFTYEIGNIAALVAFIAEALAVPPAEVQRYVDELQGDSDLRASLEARLATRPDRNPQVHYARRLGWYALARLRKPALIVETGVHDGLGSSVLARALARNRAEGAPGELLAFDIDPSAGWLINRELGPDVRLVIGDSHQTLPAALAGRAVDMFIHDSDHSYTHEMGEFEVVWKAVGPDALLLSDNAHAVTAMQDFCRAHGLAFRFFKEAPVRHFYPGGGIGLALVRPPTAPP